MPHVERRIDKQVAASLKELDRAIAGGSRDFLGLVNKLRRDVVLALVEQGTLSPATAQAVKNRVETIVSTYRQRFELALSENQRRLFVRGLKVVDDSVSSAFGPEGKATLAVSFLSEEKLTALKKFGAELVTNLSDFTRRKIAQEVDLAVLGQKPTEEVVRSIGRNLSDPSIFRDVLKRAEIIYRTEVNRVSQTAFADRLKQVAERVPDLKKRWLHSHVGVPRPGHLALDGVEVKPGAKFTLRGEDGRTYKIAGPFDPILPAGETVNCRCKLTPVVGRFSEEPGPVKIRRRARTRRSPP